MDRFAAKTRLLANILITHIQKISHKNDAIGQLLEEYGVHYIAIGDGIDSINGLDDSVAIRDLFNEWHAKDTSKKVRAVIMAVAKRKGECSPHSIKTKVLHQLVLERIREITMEAKEQREVFLQRLAENHNATAKRELAAKVREVERIRKRISDLNTLFKKAFEESALENLPRERFYALTEEYQKEQDIPVLLPHSKQYPYYACAFVAGLFGAVSSASRAFLNIPCAT